MQIFVGIACVTVIIVVGRQAVESDMRGMQVVALCLIAMAILSACAPYLEAGAGYSSSTGEYWGNPTTPLDETGAVGIAAAGVEFRDRWYLPTYCEYRHRSMIDKKPEIETDDVICAKRVYLGGRQ